LAGPIGNLTFKGKTSDTVTTTTVPARIKSIDVSVDIADSEGKVATQTYTTTLSIRKHIIGSTYYSVVSGGDIDLEGIGIVAGRFHSNAQNSKSWLVLATGTWTDSDSGYSLSVPTSDLTAYASGFGSVQSFLVNATVVSTADMVFLSGQTYSGNYYISNGKSATIQAGTTILGSIFAEGMVTVNGSGTRITPQAGLPAIVAGTTIVVPSFGSGTLQIDGSIVASGSITLAGNQLNISRTSGKGIAVISSGTLTLNSGSYTVTGALMGKNSINFSNVSNVTATAADGFPVLATSGAFDATGTSISMTGFGIVGGSANLQTSLTTFQGVWTTGGMFRVTQWVFFGYDDRYIASPPPYIWGS